MDSTFGLIKSASILCQLYKYELDRAKFQWRWHRHHDRLFGAWHTKFYSRQARRRPQMLALN